MKNILLAVPMLLLTACLSPSQEALREVNKNEAKVAVLTVSKANTSAKLLKATKDLEVSRQKFEEIYFKE